MNHQPNIIELALLAAGGEKVVAEALGVDPSEVFLWSKSGAVPDEHIATISALGGGLIEPSKISAFAKATAASVDKKGGANVIELAIIAAGGGAEVSRAFVVSHGTPGAWVARHNVPSRYIQRLCAMGNNAIRPESIIAYISEKDAEKAKAGGKAA